MPSEMTDWCSGSKPASTICAILLLSALVVRCAAPGEDLTSPPETCERRLVVGDAIDLSIDSMSGAVVFAKAPSGLVSLSMNPNISKPLRFSSFDDRAKLRGSSVLEVPSPPFEFRIVPVGEHFAAIWTQRGNLEAFPSAWMVWVDDAGRMISVPAPALEGFVAGLGSVASLPDGFLLWIQRQDTPRAQLIKVSDLADGLQADLILDVPSGKISGRAEMSVGDVLGAAVLIERVPVDTLTTERELKFIRIAADSREILSETVLDGPRPGGPTAPAVASIDDGFVVTWLGGPVGSQPRIAFIGSDGSLSDPPLTVATDTSTDSETYGVGVEPLSEGLLLYRNAIRHLSELESWIHLVSRRGRAETGSVRLRGWIVSAFTAGTRTFLIGQNEAEFYALPVQVECVSP